MRLAVAPVDLCPRLLKLLTSASLAPPVTGLSPSAMLPSVGARFSCIGPVDPDDGSAGAKAYPASLGRTNGSAV